MAQPFSHKLHYLVLTFTLILLAFVYLTVTPLRLFTAVLIGLAYFLSGILLHYQDKSLHLPVILEYLALGLLGAIILIFIALRA